MDKQTWPDRVQYNQSVTPVFIQRARRFTYSDGRSSKRQAEEQREGADFLSGQDVGQRQTAVIAAVPRMHWLKNIGQLKEIQADDRGGQDGELQGGETTDRESDTEPRLQPASCC